MRAHCLQHVPFEGPGSIAPWLAASGHRLTSTRYFESDVLPELAEIDLLIVMGGPMSANDEHRLSWLAGEKAFIREAIAAGKRVLGICLGAQLIASATGARVYPNGEKEIGWFPVQSEAVGDSSLFAFPASADVFHWHGETFDLPDASVRLARSEACENQAFQIGRSTIGLQFHLEMTAESAREIVSHCRAELVPSRYVQSEAMILSATPQRYRAANRLMSEVLSFLLGCPASAASGQL